MWKFWRRRSKYVMLHNFNSLLYHIENSPAILKATSTEYITNGVNIDDYVFTKLKRIYFSQPNTCYLINLLHRSCDITNIEKM